MSPIAIMTQSMGSGQVPLPLSSPSPKVLPTDIPRRPSPWHEIAHSLSTTSLPPYNNNQSQRQRQPSEQSSSSLASTTTNGSPLNEPPSTPMDDSVGLSQSQSIALREWEEKLSKPESDVSRHQLISPRSMITSKKQKTKLAAERDKAGYIEYKLKLIDPTPERFERLVTQMMWRLKQGRNEAIYELGLADDGTVIGLPRSQMDASLRTLELMASEVGATVIILKEIVLHPTINRKTQSQLPSSSPSTHRDELVEEDQNSQSRKSNKKNRWNQSKRRKKYIPVKGVPVYGGTIPKKLIFDSNDLNHSGSDSDLSQEFDEDGMIGNPQRKNTTNGESGSGGDKSTDDEGSSFFFEPDHDPLGESDSAVSNQNRQEISAISSVSDQHVYPKARPFSKKKDKKRRKSAAKSEARRLDLLRGDGTNPMWSEIHPTPVSDSPHFTLPHQPSRPSSLRLATPILPSPSIPTSTTEDIEENRKQDQEQEQQQQPFLDDLLHIPLDSLSLSFADVRTIPEDDENEDQDQDQSGKEDELLHDETYTSPLDELIDEQYINRNTENSTINAELGEEMICVEALVVRKIQHDEDGDVINTGEDDEEEWGYGGAEDVWGFGVDDDDE
ncbi:uncharacterized protein L201_007573 [Kwoniella dendrophila CBS 6074]|uniref:GTP binding protein 2 n=1 Tax=Kwoniella dendrophila CBS 6074 TaxID=1295534 RepID=A0AAX4K663_9TREE